MPITPDPPFPKEKGHPLRSKDWNQLVNEVQRLDTSKANRNERDFVQGPLSIASSLGVGIGNTVPRAPLHIAGGNWDLSNTEGDLRIGSDTLRLKIGVALGGGGAGDARIRAVGGTNRLMIGTGTDDTIVVQNGVVGIGTASPGSGAKLDVQGNLFVGGSLAVASNNSYHSARNADNVHYGYFEGRTLSGQRGFYLGWGTPGQYVDLRLESGNKLAINGGNVGIGTNDPGSPLHVASHMTVGPFAATGGVGGIDVTGPAAELGFVRRTLTAWPTSVAAGDRYVWYNSDGTARLWTEVVGNLLSIDTSGQLEVPSGAIFSGVAIGVDPPGAVNAPYPYETVSTTGTNYNLRLHSANAIYFHVGNRSAPSRGVSTSGDWFNSSRDIKENFSDFSEAEAIEILQDLNPIKYSFKDDPASKLHVGFIAQEVPSIIANEDGTMISEIDIVAILTKVVKTQQEWISKVQEKLTLLSQDQGLIDAELPYPHD